MGGLEILGVLALLIGIIGIVVLLKSRKNPNKDPTIPSVNTMAYSSFEGPPQGINML